MGWRLAFKEFSKTDGGVHADWKDCCFCREATRGDLNSCLRCPWHCVKPGDWGGRCWVLFGIGKDVDNERRLLICNHVIATVKRYTLNNIRPAIASQLTKKERKLYEGEK